jgi:hypothetical protein
MNYEKPMMSVMDSALVAIQGGKDNKDVSDNLHQRDIPAYQADE